MADPLVTVITTAFDRAHTIASTISSVKAQTFTDFEHLIAADGGSTDNTVELAIELAKQDDRIRVIHHAHTNQPGGNNIAIENARGRYVCFIDSDDVMLPRYLEEMTAPWERNPELGFAYTDAWRMDNRTKRVRRRTFLDTYGPKDTPLDSPEQLLSALMDLNFISEESMVTRAALEDIGGFDESLTHSTDYDVWARVLAKGYAAVRVRGPLLIHRDSPDSLSKNSAALLECNKVIYEKLTGELEPPESIRQLARVRIEEIDEQLAKLASPTLPKRALDYSRPRLGAVRKRLLDQRIYLDTPPPEIREAFPNLKAL